MRLPNPLATRGGRLSAFFALYLTEGVPLGFTATAIATQMRRHGLGPAEIGAFVGSLYLPWGLKWVVGPFVDVFSSDRFGRRRMWIVIAQAFMVITLMIALPVNFTAQLRLFTLIILVHNAFAATQDVAIDALAVNVLREDERGLANGLMFAGAYLGQAVGGSGVLFLAPLIGTFSSSARASCWSTCWSRCRCASLLARRGPHGRARSWAWPRARSGGSWSTPTGRSPERGRRGWE